MLGELACRPRLLQRRGPGRRRVRRHRRGAGPRPDPRRRRRRGPRPRPGPPRRAERIAARPRPGRGPGTRTVTWKRTATAPSPRSPTGTPSAFPVPGQPGRRARHLLAAARRGHRPAGRRGRLARGHAPSWTRCAGTSTGATTPTCRPTGRSTGSPGGAPAAPTRTRARRSWPGSARRRAASAPTRSPRWSTRWRSSTRSARPPPRPRSSPAASSPRATPAWAPTPPPTRWRSAWTSAARSGWTRSPGCSAPARTQARQRAGHPGLRRPRNRRAWSRPPSTCPARSATSSKPAERAAADDPRYEVNAAELRKVIPADLMPGEIDARLGAAWIDASYVREFLREILDDPRVRVEHPGGQIWTVRGDRHTRAGHLHLGHQPLPGPAAGPGGPGTAPHRGPRQASATSAWVLNMDETLAAQEKAAELAERFAEWAWEDPARAGAAGRASTTGCSTTSCCAPTTTRQLSLPGLALSFEPRPHQVAAVARIIHEPAVGLFHEVGAGQDRRDDHGRDGAAPPRPGPQARHRRAQPHARAVQPRVPPALPPGQGPGRPARRPARRPAPPVRRPLRHRRLGRGRHVPVGVRADPDERRRPAAPTSTPKLDRMRDFIQAAKEGDGHDRQAPRRRPAARRGTAQGQAGLGQGPRHHLRGHRHRLPVRRRGPRLQEPAHPLQHPRRRDRRVHARRRPGHEDRLPAPPQRQPGSSPSPPPPRSPTASPRPT